VSANTTYLMVLEDVANSSGPDTLNLWVNPTAGVASPSGAPDITDSLIGPIGTISGIGTNDGAATTSYDEIRIGTSYADVTPVPEPAPLALVATGGLGLLLLKRRKTV
ncbi:MAG: PEP-CTERM sorting domain-containing protein, partial [Phycisphaerae bacterium]